LIFLGSTTAFIAMVNAAVVFLQSSCAIPQAILLYRGRDKVLPERFFSPGKYGAAINATAVLWVFLLDVLYCMPSLMPVNPNNMNYVSVVSVGLVGFVISLWFVSKQKTFKGPQVDFAEIKRRREQALYGTAIEGEAGIGKVEA